MVQVGERATECQAEEGGRSADQGEPLIAVARETGFCDQRHFHKAFKRRFGITPGRYER